MQIEMGKQYRTQGGSEVRLYCVDGGGRYPVHGALKCSGRWQAASWTASGHYWGTGTHANDLIEVKPRIQREVWLNVYPSGIHHCTHDTKELADKNCCSDRIACVKITIDCEEGEGL
jgi:hypothetical protein